MQSVVHDKAEAIPLMRVGGDFEGGEPAGTLCCACRNPIHPAARQLPLPPCCASSFNRRWSACTRQTLPERPLRWVLLSLLSLPPSLCAFAPLRRPTYACPLAAASLLLLRRLLPAVASLLVCPFGRQSLCCMGPATEVRALLPPAARPPAGMCLQVREAAQGIARLVLSELQQEQRERKVRVC